MLFFAGSVLHRPPRSPICAGKIPRGNTKGIHGQHTRAGSRFSSRYQFQVFSTNQIPILSRQLILSHRLVPLKDKGWEFAASPDRDKHIGAMALHDQPTNQTGACRTYRYIYCLHTRGAFNRLCRHLKLS